MNSLGQNTGVGSLFPSPGDLPKPGIEPRSLTLQVDSLPVELPGKPIMHVYLYLIKLVKKKKKAILFIHQNYLPIHVCSSPGPGLGTHYHLQ